MKRLSLNTCKIWLVVMCSIFVFGAQTFAQVCSVDLGVSENFEPVPVWVWQKVDARETTLVWDIDGDGVPEVIADDYRNPGKIYVLDGETWATEHVINTWRDLTQNNSSNGIADLDSNGYGEVYFVDDTRYLNRWDFDGTSWNQAWISPWIVWFATNHDRYVPHFADFNADGTPEIYMWWDIFRASDGVKIASAVSGFYPWDLWWSNAMDILPDNYLFVDGPRAGTVCADCGWLELAMWSRIFTVDVVSGTVTLATEDGTWYDGRWWDALADIDNDWDVDVIYGFSIWWDAHVIVRDGQTNETLMIQEVNAASGIIWRPNVADFDGDGCNEIGVVTFRRYSVIDDVFSDDWWCPGENNTWPNISNWADILRFINNSDGSGVTWSSVFDFDYDGVYEVVYRDQTNLYILAGPDGAEKFKRSCTSSTRRENPVIADVNNDGATELVVACNNSWISAFASASDPWAPSRPVWNQHGYNVTNVNDDLTIPAVPQYNPTRAGGVHDNFLTQSLPIDANFTPTNDVLPAGHIFAADLVVDIDSIDTSDCANSMTITLDIQNIGDASAPASTPIQVYDENPLVWSVNTIGSWVLGTTLSAWSSTTVVIPMTSCSSPVYVVVNDGTSSTPYALSGGTDFPNTSLAECNYDNNIDRIAFSNFCGDGVVDAWEECDDGNGNAWDGCSVYCEVEYCRDDAPITDTSKNLAVTSLSPTAISWTSTQPNSKIAICIEDTTWSRDIYYTSTDTNGSFSYIPDLTNYTPDWLNIWVMLHDENDNDIDHHALVVRQ